MILERCGKAVIMTGASFPDRYSGPREFDNKMVFLQVFHWYWKWK